MNGQTTEYVVDGSTILGEKLPNGGEIYYFFDENGVRYGFARGTNLYYYAYNGQGDVIEIYNSGGRLEAWYKYDSWGKVTEMGGNLAVAEMNPIRYRGYYYDTETGFYYLNSRYYDPETCRFINADDPEVTTATPSSPNWDKNLFAYCDNNPVTRVDDEGEFWSLVIGAVIGAASVYVGDVIGNLKDGKSGWDILKPTSSVGSYLGAAVSGMIPGTGLGKSVARVMVSTGIEQTTDFLINKDPISIEEVRSDLLSGFAGEALSFHSDKALDKLRPKNYSSFRHQVTRRIPDITQQQTR